LKIIVQQNVVKILAVCPKFNIESDANPSSCVEHTEKKKAWNVTVSAASEERSDGSQDRWQLES
jgi:hypothetical protein